MSENTNVTRKAYLTAQELGEMIGCSTSQAYKLIRDFNAKLEADGYITVKGKISRHYVEKHWYGEHSEGKVQ